MAPTPMIFAMLFLHAFSFGQASERLRSMEPETAAMGFVTNNFVKPTRRGLVIDSNRSELFGVGLIYNSYKATLSFPKVKLMLGSEAFSDEAQIDNFGYSEKNILAEVGFYLNNFLKLGVSIKRETYLFQGDSLGSGWSKKVMLGIESQTGRFGSYNVELHAGNVTREFSTGRKENSSIVPQLNVGLSRGGVKLAMSIDSDETHLGTEYKLSENLSLRAGLNGQEPTFGLGV